jgi:hypothetical protein
MNGIAGVYLMPLAVSTFIPPLRDGDRLTRDEFLRRWDAMPDVKWTELIDGVVHMPSPSPTFTVTTISV